MIKNILLNKKTICSILTFTLLATAITGCGKSKDTSKKIDDPLNPDVSTMLSNSKTMSKDYIFKQTDYEGILKKGDYVQSLEYIGGKARAIVLGKDNIYRCISVNTDGSDAQSFDLPIDGKEISQILCNSDTDGNIYAFYYTDTSCFKKFDNTGNEVLSKTLDFDIYDMTWSEKYGLVLNTSRGIETYNDQSGSSVVIDIKKIQSTFDSDYFMLHKSSDDQFFIDVTNSDGVPVLASVDLDNKSFGKTSKTCSERGYSFQSGEGYDLYAGDYDGICGYDYESDKMTKLLDLDDSCIDRYCFLDWVAISDKELFAVTSDFDSNLFFSSFTKVDPADVPDRTMLTLGGACFTVDVTQAANIFNKSNDKYKIKVIDYADSYPDSDIDEILQAFNQDILTGNTPDILCFSNYFAPNLESYANKGVLLDLSSSFEKGGALGDVEILPNIYEMMKTGDKVYSVIPSFVYSTLLMKESVAGGKTSLTLQDYEDLKLKETMDANTFIDNSIQAAGDKFIDWKNKKCNLNCPEFVEILEFAKRLNGDKKPSDKSENEGVEVADELPEINSNGIVCDQDIYGFISFADIEQSEFKDKAAIMGFPNNYGETTTIITPYNQLCVSSTSKAPEGALEFLKCYCTNTSINSGSTFPSDKNLFESYMKKITEPPASEDDATVYTNFHEVRLDPLPADEAQKLYDSILSCKAMHRLDSQLNVFIEEETAALFSGQKSAEEIAEILDNRIRTYLNEQN
ncbi:MAG: extracellular solute-binding protein [Butyrivibrio sp.]|nr:extracellular solute-binding protein [Butyrivibrio sp.]